MGLRRGQEKKRQAVKGEGLRKQQIYSTLSTPKDFRAGLAKATGVNGPWPTNELEREAKPFKRSQILQKKFFFLQKTRAGRRNLESQVPFIVIITREARLMKKRSWNYKDS